jgi:hypothetical protein
MMLHREYKPCEFFSVSLVIGAVLLPLSTIGSCQTLAYEQTVKFAGFGSSLTARGNWQDLLKITLSRCLGRPVRVATVAQREATTDWVARFRTFRFFHYRCISQALHDSVL